MRRGRFQHCHGEKVWEGIIESFGGWLARNKTVFGVDMARGCGEALLNRLGVFCTKRGHFQC